LKLFRQLVQGRSISNIAIRTEREQRFRRDPNSFIRILSSTGLDVARYSVNPDRQHLDESIVPAILPLLRFHPCIEKAELWAGQEFEYDLDLFRDHASKLDNFAESHPQMLG